MITRPWPPRTPNWRLRWNGIRNRLARFGPTRLYNNARYFIQRGRRGYSDADVWSLDWYLCDLLVGALTQLKALSHGYPAELTEETWAAHLDKMIAGFKAARGYLNADYMVEQPDGSYRFDGALEQDILRTHRRGIAKFAVWFLHLWD